MIPREVLETALHRFRTHPLQTWLTLSGLIVGTAAIIIIVSLGLSIRTFIMSEIEAVGSHILWASYEGNVTGGVAHAVDDSINEGDVQAVAARTDLFSYVTPLVEMKGSVTVEARSVNIAVLGTTPNYIRIRRNVHLIRGRFLDDDDLSGRAKVCVVSKSLYEKLFHSDDSADKTVRTLGMTFIVIGEFENPVDTVGQEEVRPDSIFIPTTVAWFFTPTHKVDTLFAEARDFNAMPEAQKTIETILRERHHPGAVFVVESITTIVKLAERVSVGLILVFILAAAVSVVVGGVGIMNILLASVEHRTREIGLRMSLGARRQDILLQFLLEALLLGSVGSLLGVLFGVGVPLLLRAFIDRFAVELSASSAILAFAFSSGVTLLFATAPAYRAARLNPTEALRHE